MPGSISVGARAGLGHRDGPQLGVARQPLIERPEERAPAAVEVLPGILAVEDDEDRRLSPARPPP